MVLHTGGALEFYATYQTDAVSGKTTRFFVSNMQKL